MRYLFFIINLYHRNISFCENISLEVTAPLLCKTKKWLPCPFPQSQSQRKFAIAFASALALNCAVKERSESLMRQGSDAVQSNRCQELYLVNKYQSVKTVADRRAIAAEEK